MAKAGAKAGREPALVKQAHGGALWSGPPRNPVAGTGRPPDAIRAAMRELGLTKGLPFLASVLDGKVTVSLVGKCDACAHDQPINAEWAEQVMERIGTSVSDRLKATEQAMKYGLQAKELVIAGSDAPAFFDCLYTAMVEQHGEAAAEMVKARAVTLMESRGK